jgi:hypothetical protein
MRNLKKNLFHYLIYLNCFLPLLGGFSTLQGEGIGAKTVNEADVARGDKGKGGHKGGHGGKHRGGHRHGNHKGSHRHNHGRHRGNRSHFQHYHRNNRWWHHSNNKINRHAYNWNSWHRWHHPWHNAYWYGNGFWGVNPGYFYDANYYYSLNGIPSIEYENDENPYLIPPNPVNSEFVPVLPQYQDEYEDDEDDEDDEEDEFPYFMDEMRQDREHNRIPTNSSSPPALKQKSMPTK